MRLFDIIDIQESCLVQNANHYTHMKLMSYNIFDGGAKRLGLIISAIQREAPDILIINEANGFSEDGSKILKRVSSETSLPYYSIALTEWGYDVAVLSKLPFTKTEALMPNKRAAMSAMIDSPLGLISIIGAHLNSGPEDLRLLETKKIIGSQKEAVNRIIAGDMNSLSRQDGYSPDLFHRFNEKQLEKFTRKGKPRFEVTDMLLESGYHDAAVHMKKNRDTTVPTPSNEDIAHTDLRLDYVFLSESLLPHLIDYKVVRNELTDKASDHFPVVIELK